MTEGARGRHYAAAALGHAAVGDIAEVITALEEKIAEANGRMGYAIGAVPTVESARNAMVSLWQMREMTQALSRIQKECLAESERYMQGF